MPSILFKRNLAILTPSVHLTVLIMERILWFCSPKKWYEIDRMLYWKWNFIKKHNCKDFSIFIFSVHIVTPTWPDSDLHNTESICLSRFESLIIIQKSKSINDWFTRSFRLSISKTINLLYIVLPFDSNIKIGILILNISHLHI